MANVLEQIIQTKQGEVARAKAHRPLDELKRQLAGLPEPRDFRGQLAAESPQGIHLIAEIKQRSPSAGLIRPVFDPEAIARAYHRAGASAISVLTDETYFGGRLEYLGMVKAAVPLPVLRKDFIVDPYQVYESRAAGADCILLIGEALPPAVLREMLSISYDLGMATLIEVHSPDTLAALNREIGFPNDRRSLLGINNRDLSVQRTDLATTGRLAGMAGPGTILVSESGIKTRADVQTVKAAGARAILVGETLLRCPDVEAVIRELLG